MDQSNNNQQQSATHHAKRVYMVLGLVIILGIVFISFKVIYTTSPAQTSTLTLVPAIASAPVGSTFTVDVVLDTKGMDVYGIDINRLRFDPGVLQVVDADVKASGIQIAPGSLMAMTVVNTADETGTIQFSQVATPPSTYNGSGVVATVTFKVIAEGKSDVTIDFVPGSGTDSNVAATQGDILSSVRGGTYVGVK
jgi:hypothetical protein